MKLRGIKKNAHVSALGNWTDVDILYWGVGAQEAEQVQRDDRFGSIQVECKLYNAIPVESNCRSLESLQTMSPPKLILKFNPLVQC
jgi:hypothetical protein